MARTTTFCINIYYYFSVGSYVLYNTFVHFILSFNNDFSLDSDSNYHEDQEKKGLHFLKIDEKAKIVKYKMAASVYKNEHIYEYAATYARDITNMSILMFSDMRKPILSFVFRKKYCKVYIYANISQINRISQ